MNDNIIKVGDIVLVDRNLSMNRPGYEAKVVWIANYFARIKVENDEWDIMKNRLTPKE